jgi:hypothetical protein
LSTPRPSVFTSNEVVAADSWTTTQYFVPEVIAGNAVSAELVFHDVATQAKAAVVSASLVVGAFETSE